jgi:opacity protein-like surface antigen
MRTKLCCSLFVLASLLGAAAAANAQDDEDDMYMSDPPPPKEFEIAAFGGYRGGGRFDIQSSDQDIDLESHGSLALGLDWRIDENQAYELFYSRQKSNLEDNSPFGPVDLDVEYLHIGGTVVTNDERRVKPYILGGLGVTRFSPDVPGVSDETHFSLNLGGGLRVPFNDFLSLRFEARGYVTFVDTETALFCVSGSQGGLCNIRGSGNAFFQYDVLAGLAVRF